MKFKILFPVTVALLLSIMIPSAGIQAQQPTPQDAAYFAFPQRFLTSASTARG